MSYTIQQLKDMCRDLETALDSWVEERSYLEKQLDLAETELDKALDDYHELRQERDELKQELEALREAKP